MLKAAANIARALTGKGKKASLSLVMPECNSFGLGLLTAPGLDAASWDAQAGADIAIVLENDLYRRLEIDEVDDFLLGFRHVVVIDHLFHRTALKADMVLPAATFAEEDGTLVNNEGRAQRYFQVFPAGGQVRPSWRWLRDVMASQGRPRSADLAQCRCPHRLHGTGGSTPWSGGRRRAVGGASGLRACG